MTQLTIDGTMFRIDVAGEPHKPALVLSNSLGTTLELWDGQMLALLEHFRVIRYDSRGHGGSVDTTGPFSIRRLGRDVLAILDALGIETAHFVGISMGGAVGQWLLVNAPHRIERAVLANTAARIGTSEGWNARIRSVLADGMDATATASMERWFSAGFADRNPQVVAAQREMMRQISARGYAASCAALRDMDLRQAIHGLRHSVLIVAGADDPVTSAADSATLLSALGNATLVTLECRHLSNVEAPAAFNHAVLTFLTGKIAPRIARVGNGSLRARATRRVGARTLVVRRPVKKASTAKPGAIRKTPSKGSGPSAEPAPVAAKTPQKTSRKIPTKRAATGAISGKTGRGSPKRTVGSPTTRTATRKAVKAATAAPSRHAASKRVAVSAPRAAAAKASLGKGAAKAGTRSKSSARVAPARRVAPAASARASKAKSPGKPTAKIPVAKPKAGKGVPKNTGGKLPSPRRKSSTGRAQTRSQRRGKGRGKS